MKRGLQIILLFILFISCLNKKDMSSNFDANISDRNNKSTIAIHDFIIPNNFIDELNNVEKVELPFSLREYLFRTYSGQASDNHETLRGIKSRKNSVLDSILTFEMINKDELFFKTDVSSPEVSSFFHFYKRLPLIPNTDIECLIFGSNYQETHADFWVLATFDKSIKQFIDIKTIAVYEQAADLYYDTGLYINTDLLIKSIYLVSYESPLVIRERKFQVQSTGKIKLISDFNYSSSGDCILVDYINDYKLISNQDIIESNIRKELFNLLLTQVNKIELPYSSISMNKFFSVKKEYLDNVSTGIFHDKLSSYDSISFFMKSTHESFILKNRRFQSGNYTYPVIQFDRNNSITVIGYLYQSFCNLNPTVYVKFISYNKNGEIIDSKIINRSFYNGYYRFTNEFNVDDFFVIENIRTGESTNEYESMSIATKIEIEKTQITEQGFFKSIK